MDTVVKRAERLADFAQENGVRLLVDAEQTYFQPAIRHIAVNVLMPKYNMDTPTIYNTIQCYCKVRPAGGEEVLSWQMSCLTD